MELGCGKDTSERRQQQPQPIRGHKWSWHTKFKLPFPIMVLLQHDICHYAEKIEDTVKVMGGSEHVNNMEYR